MESINGRADGWTVGFTGFNDEESVFGQRMFFSELFLDFFAQPGPIL
jgi:hypothetical protein